MEAIVSDPAVGVSADHDQDGSAAIEVRGLEKRLGSFRLGPLDLRVPTGFAVGFVGPNGAGKTTTIKTILGLHQADAGSVHLFGSEAPGAPTANDRIGVVLDTATVHPGWRVNTIGRRLHRFYTRWDQNAFVETLERFDVPSGQRAGELSRGQSVKLSLAVALAHHPELLILDEPSSGLDPVSRSELVDVLRTFLVEPDHSVLFSTHITTDLEHLADYICVLGRGRVDYSGTLDDLHDRFAVIRGEGDLTADARSAAVGLRIEGHRFDGLIDIADTALFGPDVVIDPATTDDVVVYLARQSQHGQEVSA